MIPLSDTPQMKSRWPLSLRLYVGIEVGMLVLVVAAMFADTPGQQVRYALLMGAGFFAVRWGWRKIRGPR